METTRKLESIQFFDREDMNRFWFRGSIDIRYKFSQFLYSASSVFTPWLRVVLIDQNARGHEKHEILPTRGVSLILWNPGKLFVIIPRVVGKLVTLYKHVVRLKFVELSV